MYKHRWVAAVILMCSFGLAESQVYKWVDEDGNVHYSDKPPVNQQSTEVEIQQPAPAPEIPEPDEAGETGDTKMSAEAWLEQQRAEREADRQQKKSQKWITEADTSQQCSNARRMLDRLEIQCPAFYDDRGILRVECPYQPRIAYEGERRYIEDADRAASISHYREVLKNCDNANQ
jgi:hypothetical protein